MIKSGYSSINESVSGELAAAMKVLSSREKHNLMVNLSAANIDFNRSIGDAEKIKDNDPRLKVDGNFVIGVYEDVKGKKCITVYQVGKGPIIDTNWESEVKDQSGKIVKIQHFANASWKKWVSIMSSFYIIEKDKAVPVKELRQERVSLKKIESESQISELWSNKVKEICARYGYSIDINTARLGPNSIWRDVNIRNNKRDSKVEIRYDSKTGFMIHTWGTSYTESEAKGLIEDATKALELVHKLNQVNLDKVKISKE